MCHISILMGSKRQICIKQKQTFYDLFGGGKTKISMQIIQLGNFDSFSGSSLAHKAYFKSDHKKKSCKIYKFESNQRTAKQTTELLRWADQKTTFSIFLLILIDVRLVAGFICKNLLISFGQNVCA